MTMPRLNQLIALLVAFALTASAHADDALRENSPHYNRDVRPILSKHCLACHGLDEDAREAGLRLDVRGAAIAELDSGETAIVPGNAQSSEVVARVVSDDPDLRMPPADRHEPLSAAEIETLTRWIDAGADYQQHWSLVPPEKKSPPEIVDEKPDLSPIDAFVRKRLATTKLQPAPAAAKYKLIRRLSLDLTGLPPSPTEVQTFVDDQRPDAYQRLVDRLLASPHYGERMAVNWLDAARYADTHGYHIDSHRDMWPWRDWVIDAFNDNLPFDDFTVWQLAGDLLPNATREQQIASGFNRNHGINYEGGAIPEEYLVEYVVDRANTTGTVWMGLTLGCARCHDHKYDPISQEEYFKFFAFFNTIDEKGLDGQRGNAVPNLPLPTKQQQSEQQRLTDEIEQLKQKLKPWEMKLDDLQHDWERKIAAADGEAIKQTLQDSHWYRLGPQIEETASEVLQHDHLTPATKVDINQPVQIKGKPQAWTKFDELIDGHTHNFPWERSANYLVRTITVDKPQRVTVSIGCSDALKFWFNGQLLVDRDRPVPVVKRQHEFDLELQAGKNQLLVKIVNISWECDFYFALRASTPRLPLKIEKILAKMRDARSTDDSEKLKDFYRENIAEAAEYHQLQTELLAKRRQLDELVATIPTTMVMREMSQPRKTFRLDRGQYDSPQEEVVPTTPSVLPPLPTDSPTNRLALARWLTDPAHPLTARVTVNRLWQMLFGVGLVATSGDFGTQGEWPSHPELLDWLAVELVDSGWDVKHMLRLIVMSETYRQSSAATPEKIAIDPNNRLLSRGPRFRLQAEFIRDLALKTSGLLNDRIGGPSAKNYQPPGLWLELAHQKDNSKFTAQQFEQASGDELYRRGLYTFWKRSVPPPNLITFDAPNRETCTVQREITNTPLQALVLLNDPTYVEAARALAERVMREAETDRQRASRAFLLVTSREPSDQEIDILLKQLVWQRTQFADESDAAEKLLDMGDSPRDASLTPAEHAAWTSVASLILNLDETITKE